MIEGSGKSELHGLQPQRTQAVLLIRLSVAIVRLKEDTSP